jgi:hypothetical protein
VLAIVTAAEAASLVLVLRHQVPWPASISRIFGISPSPAVQPDASGLPEGVPTVPGPADMAGAGPGATVPPSTGTHGAANDAAAGQGAQGWVYLVSEIPLRVYLDGNFVASGSTLRFPARAGDHAVTLVNDSLGYMLTQSVKVPAGESLVVRPTLVRDAPAARP